MKNNLFKGAPVLLAGGFDPTNQAGLTADLEVMHQFCIKSYSVVTALTAQNEKCFFKQQVLQKPFFLEQLNSLNLSQKVIIKIGMLGSETIVHTLFEFLKHLPQKKLIILDPVFSSSSGASLLSKKGIKILCENILDEVDYLTPNFIEMKQILKNRASSDTDLVYATQLFIQSRPTFSLLKGIILKGGHSENPGTDYLITRKEIKKFKAKALAAKVVHGTGCSFASSIAAAFSLGKNEVQSILFAKNRVRKKIRNSPAQ